MKYSLVFLLGIIVLLSTSFVSAQTLRIGMVNQDPDPVFAGDVVEVRFKLENTWEDTKYDVRVEILPEYPFSLYSSSAIKEFGRLEGSSTGADAVYFDYKFFVDPDASDGEHEIDLEVFMGDRTKWKLEDMFFIDIEKEELEIKPYVVASDLTTSGKRGSFTIEIANSGGQDVEALELELFTSEDYKLLSTSNYVYLGDLESDDTESEDFSIYVPVGTQEVNIPLKLTYKANDKEYIEQENLMLRLLSDEEAKKVGLIKVSYTPYIIAGLVIGIILIFFIRRFKKKG